MTWHNFRHSIDEWNDIQKQWHLNLIAPLNSFVSIDTRFCDIIQHRLVAIVLSTQDSISRDELLLVLSMCNRFHIPCVIDQQLSFIEG